MPQIPYPLCQGDLTLKGEGKTFVVMNLTLE